MSDGIDWKPSTSSGRPPTHSGRRQVSLGGNARLYIKIMTISILTCKWGTCPGTVASTTVIIIIIQYTRVKEANSLEESAENKLSSRDDRWRRRRWRVKGSSEKWPKGCYNPPTPRCPLAERLMTSNIVGWKWEFRPILLSSSRWPYTERNRMQVFKDPTRNKSKQTIMIMVSTYARCPRRTDFPVDDGKHKIDRFDYCYVI